MNEYPRKLKEELKSIIRQMSSLPELLYTDINNEKKQKNEKNRKMPKKAAKSTVAAFSCSAFLILHVG